MSLAIGRTHLPNTSEHTLATVRLDSPTPSNRSLLSPTSPSTSYGTTHLPHTRHGISRTSTRRLLFKAGMKMAAIFIVSTLLLGGTLWLALPRLDDEDRPNLRIPKSFAQLQALNALLQKYRSIYPFRIVVCFISTYLFIQAFSIPGSMYLSILAGAMWGVPRALLLCCACVASGATLCYLLSAALGPALLALPSWHARLHTWSAKVATQRENLLPFMIVLRIAPLPPHWVVNVLAPHLGIGIAPFWLSTALGMVGVTVIHTTIGGGLDDMTSAEDFHLISWRNFLGLSAVVVGVLIPVALRYYFRRELEGVRDVEREAQEETEVLGAALDIEAGESLVFDAGEDERDRLLAEGPVIVPAKGKGVGQIYLLDDEDAFFDEDGQDDDIILEAGPAIILPKKDGKDESPSGSA